MYFDRSFDAMREFLVETIALDAEFPWAHDWLGMAYVQLRDFDRALPVYERAVELSDRTAEVLAGLGHAHARAGNRAAAAEILTELEAAAERSHVPPVQRAYVAFGLGDVDRGFELLEEAYRMRAWELVFIREEPWFDDVRSDVRFAGLVDRIGFPPRP